MKDKDIEAMLQALENGEISDDGAESDGDDLDYYPSRSELVDALEDNDDGRADEVDDSDDPPLVQEEDTAVNDGDPALVSEDNVPSTSQSSIPSVTRNLLWRKRNLVFSEDKIAFLGSYELPSHLMDLESPYQFFSYFFTNEFIDSIVHQTNLYAVEQQPNRTETFTKDDFRKYLGIIIFMSVYRYPNTRSYWGKFGFGPIRETMPVNKFEKFRKILHFNDNSKHLPAEHPDHDKLHKLRPVIEHLNQRFSSVPITQRLSIDEQMCSTKVGHFLKQYMPNKPHKWGFKLFNICNLLGYAYKFIIYSGKEKDDRLADEPDLGVVAQTVLKLIRVVPRQRNHIVYFDNYYTSIPLMHFLAKQGIHSLGTIQRNRLGKSCKLPSKQEVMKKSVPRGQYEEYVTSLDGVDITAVSWKDNKQVVLTSTYVGAEPAEKADRYDKKEKRKIQINCPKLVKEYNIHMGGVDLMDAHLGRYRIHLKSRKWYMRIFYHLLDLTIINAWILYKQVNIKKNVPKKDIMDLASFRSELADTLCKYSSPIPRGRPSSSSLQEPPAKLRKGKPCQVLPPSDVIRDGIGHEQIRTPDRQRCMFPSCNLKTVTMCSKCKVHLCAKKSKNCFNEIHRN